MNGQFLQNDQDLMVRLKSGDKKAFATLYKLYAEQIFRRLMRLVKQESIAEELLQDVFMRIWENLENIDLEKPFRAYLYRIAQNLVTDLFRRAAYEKQLLDYLIEGMTELYNPIEESEHEVEVKHLLQQAIDSLPTQRRKVYILCKLEGKTYVEASQLLGMTVSTISDHIVKANKALAIYAANQKISIVLLATLLICDLK
ncbi:sigma-70 family RNA polymerase sigma factor [Pedobacter sp. ISL-68]|uniref:RNA polymerase sigma factor n=1 Tax=unclassified Pedobacter TaxID=2628915 RepID=UPI001BE6A632|nr:MULTISPECIES: sigma-70 family RNA polymerase sigma factor [unclassified Pedobacter]MBT2563114.1 sigma-70 family RNA polymerase sigma factor [Pedobacter sp. ISL-64]MBT2593452.1 sigma-70 family RNA polymerase sigma factor [Pedobacter sp. ISL-68]